MKIVALLILISTTSMSTTENSLVLYGKITEEASVQVEILQENNQWLLLEKKELQKDFLLIMDPKESYKISFTNLKNRTKTIITKPGKQGIYYVNLDISFENYDNYYHLYQIGPPNSIEYDGEVIDNIILKVIKNN